MTDPITLKVERGPAAGQTLRIESGSATIGRVAGNALVVEDPAVSRQHARIFERGGTWWIADLNSTHGSFVNDLRVTRSELHDGDVIRLGESVLRLCTGVPAASSAAELRAEMMPEAPREGLTRDGQDPFAEDPANEAIPEISLRRPPAAPSARIELRQTGPSLIHAPHRSRLGFLGHDLAQRGRLARWFATAVALTAGAGLFWLTLRLLQGGGADQAGPRAEAPGAPVDTQAPTGPSRVRRP